MELQVAVVVFFNVMDNLGDNTGGSARSHPHPGNCFDIYYQNVIVLGLSSLNFMNMSALRTMILFV
jgi:hypothetical protein